MNVWSSALIFYIDWDFYLGHMSMDVSSDLAALSSHGVPWVTGTNIQVASPRGCTPGLAGPEPCGTFIHSGQHLHGSRGYLNGVPAGPIPSLAPQGIAVNTVGPQEVTISLCLCCATEALRRFPCSSPQCPRGSRIACSGGHHYEDASRRQPPAGWDQEAYATDGAPQELGGTATTNITPLENFEVNLWTSRSVVQPRCRPRHAPTNGPRGNPDYPRQQPIILERAVG